MLLTQCLIFVIWGSGSVAGLHGHTVYIRDIDGPNLGRRSFNGESLPQVLPVALSSDDGFLARLVLRANSRIPNDIGVKFDNEELNKRGALPLNGIGLYQDSFNDAAVLVDHSGAARKMQGVVHHEGVEYDLFPVDDEAAEETLARHGRSLALHGHPHVLRRVEQTQNYNHFVNTKTVERTPADNMPTKRAGNYYEVEYQMWLDKTEYDFWVKAKGSHDAAVTEMKKMTLSHYNLVDLAYSNIDKDGYDLTIRIFPWDIFILTDASSNTFITSNFLGDSGKGRADPLRNIAIDGKNVLKALQAEIYTVGKSQRIPDHAQLITRYDIGQMKSGSLDVSSQGMAFPGRVCYYNSTKQQYWGASVVEDVGYGIWKAGAHELAHNLGALHDTSACPGGYIQYWKNAYPSTYRVNTRFSSCSVSEMKEALAKPSYGKPKTCVLQTDCSRVTTPGGYVSAGQGLTKDEVCRWYFGSGSTPCGSYLQGDEMCQKMFCTHNGKCGRDGLWSMVVDGMECNPGQECSRGYCMAKNYENHVATANQCRYPPGTWTNFT